MKCIVLLLLLCVAAPSWAGDNGELFSIDADTVQVDDDQGTTTYAGNARARVLNVVIEAQTIVLFRDNGLPARIEAAGSPLRFHQTGTADNLSGTARSLVFSTADLKLELMDYSISDPAGNNLKGQKATFVLSP